MSLLKETIWEYYGIVQQSQIFFSLPVSVVNSSAVRTWCGCHQCKAQRIWWICIKFTAHLLVFLKLSKTLENYLGGGKKPL